MLMTRSELAASTGLSEATIRDYEQLGLIIPIMVAGRSVYGGEARLRLEVIAKARQLGFSLRETKSLINAEGPAEANDAPPVIEDQDENDLDGRNGLGK